MDIGYIGLGKMGLGQTTLLAEKGFNVVAWNRSTTAHEEVKKVGVSTAESIKGLVDSLEAPRTIWVMVTHSAVDDVLGELVPLLSPGDTVIDGGNSMYKDSVRRGKELAEKQIHFMDCGVSGGPGGARSGACLMIGGPREIYDKNEELFKNLSAPDAFQYMGETGAGHFTKMVHNGIEYGMMQAIAEGFNLLKKSDFNLSLGDAAKIYNNQSVIESRLIEWTQNGFEQYGEDLEEITSTVSHSGEGQWTVDFAHEIGEPAPVIEESLQFRKDSAENPSYIGKVLSMMRNMFGGHNAK